MPADPAPIQVKLPGGETVEGQILDRSRFGIQVAYVDAGGLFWSHWFSPSTAVARPRSPAERFYVDRLGAAVVGPQDPEQA